MMLVHVFGLRGTFQIQYKVLCAVKSPHQQISAWAGIVTSESILFQPLWPLNSDIDLPCNVDPTNFKIIAYAKTYVIIL